MTNWYTAIYSQHAIALNLNTSVKNMEYLKCKACGCFSMVPVDVELGDMEDFTADMMADEDEAENNLSLDELLQANFELDDDDDDADLDEEEEEEEEDSSPLSEALMEQETRFFSCHVCGDNWLSIKEVHQDGACKIVFIHQMGATPILKRVADMQTQVVLNHQTVAEWSYFLDDNEVDETEWLHQLDNRRHILKAICSN